MQCSESGAVSYKRDVANVLALDINPADATNKEELEEYKVPSLGLVPWVPSCLPCTHSCGPIAQPSHASAKPPGRTV